MIRRKFIAQSAIALAGLSLSKTIFADALSLSKPVKKILVTGGAYGPPAVAFEMLD